MDNTAHRAIAIVGVGAILPDAPNAPTFWNNVKAGRYSITDVTADRWDPALYYDPDPNAPDKTYSKIGGWVREYAWEPIKWHLPIPPRVAEAMDIAQEWAVACTREALEDYGYPKRPLNAERTAVILGNAMAGEKHYLSSLRVFLPEYARELNETSSFAHLPESVRREITSQFKKRIKDRFAPVTEDTMPGELANCMAGRIANLYNFHGPNFICDAACASAMAAITAAAEGLLANEFDVAVTGGVDRNMGAPTFVKFCKIGALSATGTRPYAEGADGFVMGEGAAILLLKRLTDAERDGDKVYAVLRGIGGSSDGKGKGITAPNPIGQKLCIERAWQNAGLSPSTMTLVEGHGTSTRVGDVVEAQSMAEVLSESQLPKHSIAIGSVKSNIGHLKSAAGAAGILKTAFALRDKVLPPSLHCEHQSPDIDFAHSPLYVNTELNSWDIPAGAIRRAGISAFGFGGTNFHLVMEEHIPGKLNGNGKRSVSVALPTTELREAPMEVSASGTDSHSSSLASRKPIRGAFVVGASTEVELTERLRTIRTDLAQAAQAGLLPPEQKHLRAPERIAIDYADVADLTTKLDFAIKALTSNQPAFWRSLGAKGIFRGHGAPPKVAFLYPGQGSQYVNMLRKLRDSEPIVAKTFAEADRVMTPLLGKPLSAYIFTDEMAAEAFAEAEQRLLQTAITQPAVLTADIALTRLLAAYGIRPDMTMGHSLGEYAALVAAGALPFDEALEAVSARGREMTRVAIEDCGRMAAVFAPLNEIERLLKAVDGYVVIANLNSDHQAVIGGASKSVEKAIELFTEAGFDAVPLQVSHAFHTSIVAPASEPLRQVLKRLHLQAPRIATISNVTGSFYPTAVPEMMELLGRQIASPVQFVKGLHTLHDSGARVFIEIGPKKALHGFTEDVFHNADDVLALFTNHPKVGEEASFNQALCGLYAAGLGVEKQEDSSMNKRSSVNVSVPGAAPQPITQRTPSYRDSLADNRRLTELGNLFADVLERGWKICHGDEQRAQQTPVVITGAALGLPGTEHIFDDSNIERILRGDQFITQIPMQFRRAMLDKNITRLVKSENGGPTFATIDNLADVIKLGARGGAFDIETEFGISADRRAALDRTTALAIAAGIDALRDAGIPLIMRYRTTSKGTQLPDRWGLPDELRDDTGVIFASAFPGYDSFAQELSRFHIDRARRQELATLEGLRQSANGDGKSKIVQDIERRITELRTAIETEKYVFDRRFLFRTLSMGHSQFAELVGARGPNTQVNAACASTTQAVSLAEDWIRAGRCRRVIVVSADDATSDNLIDWLGAGFLASGAAATDEVVEDAATPFDRRRHGMIIGMGAAAIVIESADAANERGLRPICEVLSAVTANSAYHGTRLDIDHISSVMESLVAKAEACHGISRTEIAPKTVFVSHETYTPARGGSAAAEVNALRYVFGDAADQIVIANTKGLTGHAMGTGVEDVVAIKALETSCVPPVANFKEVDPELGSLNLSKGGPYPVEYALRLGAGFGSQISMTLVRWVRTEDGRRPGPTALGYATRLSDSQMWKNWLAKITCRDNPELEVVQRTLRVRDKIAAAKKDPEIAVAQAKQVATPRAVPATSSTPPVTLQVAEPEAAMVTEISGMTTADQTLVPTAEPVTDRVLRLVAEKTGYPIEMLDLDLDLEADLGIDTVKQAEVFASIREAYGIARDDTVKLRDFPTLKHVVGFVNQRLSTLRIEPITSQLPTVTEKADTTATAPVPLTEERKGDPVKERILSLVAEKTGYPSDMLDLDLDLEADLGIDTVKQAEMFAAIRELYDIPRDENRRLRDYPTLAHVIRFVHERRPDLLGSASPASTTTASVAPVATSPSSTDTTQTVPAAPVPGASDHSVKDQILQLVADKTGYPTDMLDLDLDLEADLGIDTVKQAEMFAAIRERYNIPRNENRKLRDYPTLAHVIRFVTENRPKSTQTVAPPTLISPSDSAPVPKTEDALAGDIDATVLRIVAEKTGYPKDMLDLDLDLEADLGIDTVKQAEMFASVRSAFNIPRDTDLKLRDFPTLAHVIKFARERRGDSAPETSAPARAATLETKAHLPQVTLASFDAANAIPRRVPVPILRPALAVCKETGVHLSPKGRVVVMPDRNGVAEELCQRLRAIGVEVLKVEGEPDPDSLTQTLRTWLAAGSINGVYWLPALDIEPSLGEMTASTWHEALRVRVKLLYTTMRALYAHVAEPDTFLVSATRLGGQHGYDSGGATAPLGGGVVGFTKAYKRERPNALIKAVDFATQSSAREIADALVEETLHDPGVVEIGRKDNDRWSISLKEITAARAANAQVLSPDTVFLVTGAAGSIVSAITADLAAASGGTFYLLDLVPAPDPANPDLKRFVSDKDGLKRELFARIQARGERATPALVEKELAALERSLAAQTAIEAVRSAGGTAHYFSVTLTDSESVARIVDEIRRKSGRIDVLLHAAGLERSHFLPDKDPREFDLVFDVKVDGWFNLLHALDTVPLGATVAFSSIAGRFGNAGQTDYSAANDLLCKLTSNLRRARPSTRALAIDWTAWARIGMATRGSIPKMMELAGIDMLPPEAGIPIIRRELTSGNGQGEIVIAQRLGVLEKAWDPTGGIETITDDQLIFRRVIGTDIEGSATIETRLVPAAQPFLNDHRIDGIPVLPGVMGIEAFAQAASSLARNWKLQGLEDVNFLAPFKFYKNEPRTLQVKAQLFGEGDAIVADCKLIGERKVPPHAEPQLTTHFTGRVHLSKELQRGSGSPLLKQPDGTYFEAAGIYQVYFHGPAYRVLDRVWIDGDSIVGKLALDLPPDHAPSTQPFVASPRLIELCFQTAGIWEISTQQRFGLPRHIGKLEFWLDPAQQGTEVFAIVRRRERSESFDAEVIDSRGNKILEILGYQTIALPIPVNTELLRSPQPIAA